VQSSVGVSRMLTLGKTLVSFGLFSGRCGIAAEPLLSHHHSRACEFLHQLSGDLGHQSGASQDGLA
jgi:hypothetical protein